ncbi:MAG: SDR family oxidoreductase [Oscillospiraceae bacterium]|nr:SDR family oxidoreductase [Oscillospiraceae bacterium]
MTNNSSSTQTSNISSILQTQQQNQPRKTAVITGGTGTIGQALVEIISKRYDVVFTYHHNKTKAIELERLHSAKAYRCDITDINVAKKLASRHKADLLVNNAGISQIKMFADLTELDWYKMMDVHLTGSFYFTQAFLPAMVKQKSGCIINISSIWGIKGASCEVHYSTAKAGLIGFTKALAKEYGPSGIKVNCIAPGVISGGMNKDLPDDVLESLKAKTALGKLGTARDVAIATLYLAGAEFVTGQVLSVDGGFEI